MSGTVCMDLVRFHAFSILQSCFDEYVIHLSGIIEFIIETGDVMIRQLSEFLMAECRKQGLTNQALAERCNNQISADYIGKIKNKVPKTVSIDILNILAVGLGMTLKQLLEEAGIIDTLDHYTLNNIEADKFIEQLSDYISPFVNVKEMSAAQRIELANYIYDNIRMVSYKYK